MNPVARITLATLAFFGASQHTVIADPPQVPQPQSQTVRTEAMATALAMIEAYRRGQERFVEPLPGEFPVGGTRYCIRVYTSNNSGYPQLPQNPNVLQDGVIGYNTLLVADPPVAPAPASKPAEKPEAKPAPPAPQSTLDELLGLKPKPTPNDPAKPGDTPPADPTAPDQSKTDLDRLLTAQEMGDALKQAITLMGDAASRLTEHKDPGLGTQRVQEDVVKRLDQLLASLDKQQSQGSPQPKPQPSDPKQQPGPKKPSPGKPEPQPKGDGSQEHEGPTLQQGQLKPELESARAAWGSLPARVRDMLMQGTEDRFSARYKAMTQEYYKRLAEENHK